jgi:hypothetical protein
LPIITVGEPGVHGAVVTGIHGAGVGVNTPLAAAVAAEVAAATAGFDCVVHIPNGGMFFPGMLSIILAAGVVVNTFFSGVTTSVLGAMPKEHVSVAPAHTCIPIGYYSRLCGLV